MPEFTGRYRVIKLKGKEDLAALKDFSCGAGQYDQDVNRLVAAQYDGSSSEHPTIIVIEDASARRARTMGVCAWRPHTSPVSDEPEPLNEVYIHLIGIAKTYREHWINGEQGDLTLGRLLLGVGLAMIEQERTSMPAVWALVATGNTKSRKLFGYHEFASYPLPPPNDEVMWRPPALGVRPEFSAGASHAVI